MSKRHREELDERIFESCSHQLHSSQTAMTQFLRDAGFKEMQILCVWDKTHACLRRLVLALHRDHHTLQTGPMQFFVVRGSQLGEDRLANLCTTLAVTCFSLACKITLQHGFRCSSLRTIARVCAARHGTCVAIDGNCVLSLKKCEIYILELVGWSCGAQNMPGLVETLEADFDCDLNNIIVSPLSMAFHILEQAMLMSHDARQTIGVRDISRACMYCIQNLSGDSDHAIDHPVSHEAGDLTMLDLRLVRALQRRCVREL